MVILIGFSSDKFFYLLLFMLGLVADPCHIFRSGWGGEQLFVTSLPGLKHFNYCLRGWTSEFENGILSLIKPIYVSLSGLLELKILVKCKVSFKGMPFLIFKTRNFRARCIIFRMERVQQGLSRLSGLQLGQTGLLRSACAPLWPNYLGSYACVNRCIQRCVS